MKKSALAAALLFGALAASNPASAGVVVSNTGTGSSVATFGRGGSFTYGQVFRAPVTGILTNFSFWLNSAITDLKAGVGTWNDADLTFGFGQGSPTNLFLSSSFNGNGQTTATPGVNVVAGQIYVAYLTVFGSVGDSSTTSFQLGSANPDLGYFVWNNTTSPVGNPSWNYFFNTGNARFSAQFDSPQAGVPEPASWMMMLFGFFAVGAAMRSRRKPAVKVSYSHAI